MKQIRCSPVGLGFLFSIDEQDLGGGGAVLIHVQNVFKMRTSYYMYKIKCYLRYHCFKLEPSFSSVTTQGYI